MTAHSNPDEIDLNSIYAEVQAALNNDDIAGAISKLSDVTTKDPSGKIDALFGITYFRSEKYHEAENYFKMAVELDSTQSEWQEMLDASAANSKAEVEKIVPEIFHFDREELLGAPPDPVLPVPLDPLVLPYQLHKLKHLRPFVGRTVGAIGSITFNFLTNTLGRRYNGKVWTNWYKKSLYHGVFTLAYMREKLNADNLKTTYPKNAKIGFQKGDLPVPQGVSHFRTADGSWNNLDDPKEGAAHTRFLRNVTDSAIKESLIKADEDLLIPNPRVISSKLLARDEEMRPVVFLNMLAAAWIQFQNHDWISHGENTSTGQIEIPLPEGDPAREKYQQTKIVVDRTQPDPSYQGSDVEKTPVTFVNEVTHWWDGSQIYGSDQKTQDRLRSNVGGRLQLEEDGRLPLSSQGVEDTGFVRNWWVGLAMLHNLFALEHNSICDRLSSSYPDWDDDRLFNVARLINAAVMAKIHSVEWTPAVLPNGLLSLGLNSNWYGMLTYKFRKGKNRKTVAAFNVDNPELGGLVGNKIDKHGAPYGLSEEFVEVYRLHSLLPETLNLRSHITDEEIKKVPFVSSRQAGSPKLTDEVNMIDMFYSFGNQHPGALELNNYPHFMRELSIPGNPVYDMGAIDILRARERGVPRYNEFRRQLGLKSITTFEELNDSKEYTDKIKEVYGDDIEKIDLLIGTLAESHRPTGFGFGETMFQIFILNASRRLQADRFFTDDYREEVYTKEGMQWIDDSSFKSVILRHYPELENTGLGNIKNAFEPWDPESRLNPDRHPLRAFDPELKKNPQQGDAFR
jgi:hypothetical protein